MDEYLTLYAALAGATVGGIIGLASAYLIQRQRFKRENVIEMRDEIYGPMFMNISKILEDLTLFGYLDYTSLENLKQVMNDYLFFTMKPDLKSKLSELVDRIEKYQKVKYAAELVFGKTARKEVEKAFKIDIGSDATQIVLRLLIGETMASAISLKEAIFLKLTPTDFVTAEKQKWGKDALTEVSIGGGRSYSLNDFESLYAGVMNEMEREPLYLEEKKQRIRLMQELEHFLGRIKGFVKLE